MECKIIDYSTRVVEKEIVRQLTVPVVGKDKKIKRDKCGRVETELRYVPSVVETAEVVIWVQNEDGSIESMSHKAAKRFFGAKHVRDSIKQIRKTKLSASREENV